MSAESIALREQEDVITTVVQVYQNNNDETSPLAPCEYVIPAREKEVPATTDDDNNKDDRENYYYIREIFIRFLAFIYFLSFLGHFNQDVSLLGQNGVWPARFYLSRVIKELNDGTWNSVTSFPGVFALLPICDICISLLALAGMIISLTILFTGIVGCGACLTLWIIEFSLVSLMAELPKHNGDLLLLEAGFLAIFLYSPFLIFERQGKKWKVPSISRWAFRFLVYRVMFSAGVSKIRGSEHWFDGTGFKYLLQSITLPNPVTHRLFNIMKQYPAVNVAATNSLLFAECVSSIFLLVPIRGCRIIGGIIAMLYSICFNIIGNFGYFYMLLACCSCFCFDDSVVMRIFRRHFQKASDDADDLETQRNGAAGLMADEESGKAGHKNEEEEEEEGISVKIIKALTYESKKDGLRELLFSKAAFGMEMQHERYHRIQEIIQTAIISCIAMLVINIITERSNIALKSCIIFCLSLLMQIQCDAIGTVRAYHAVSGTLFLLHVWLVIEIMAYGVGVWNLWLWLTITEMQIGLCRTASRLNNTTRILMQSTVMISVMYYSLPLVVKCLEHSRPNVGFKAPFGIVNSYDGFGILPEERYQMLIQGTQDSSISSNTEWKTYELNGVPGNVDKRPLFLPGYNYELDNLMHDVLNRDLVKHPKAVPAFMLEFIRALLHNKDSINKLLSSNPFKNQPPKYVRVMQYKYQFSGPNEKSWYTREAQKQIIPPLTLEKPNDHKNAMHDKHVSHSKAEKTDNVKKETVHKPENVVHVVHKMPAAKNIRGVPLELAEDFVQTVPVTGSLMLTRL